MTGHALDEMRKDSLSTIDVKYAIRSRLVIIKDVPVGVCQECGQRYYAAATLDRLDTMAQNSDTAPERISVPVMVMGP